MSTESDYSALIIIVDNSIVLDDLQTRVENIYTCIQAIKHLCSKYDKKIMYVKKSRRRGRYRHRFSRRAKHIWRTGKGFKEMCFDGA